MMDDSRCLLNTVPRNFDQFDQFQRFMNKKRDRMSNNSGRQRVFFFLKKTCQRTGYIHCRRGLTDSVISNSVGNYFLICLTQFTLNPHYETNQRPLFHKEVAVCDLPLAYSCLYFCFGNTKARKTMTSKYIAHQTDLSLVLNQKTFELHSADSRNQETWLIRKCIWLTFDHLCLVQDCSYLQSQVILKH